ncbi:DUF2955 domain-containing protein [Microbulbifer hainanensis]|uniref:DUF2955 domain-containing protein n=1 Tax=Microbulbifer hainanensis TaxID=2735675 RepID=UPI001868AD58|nr:DUF2955 domain-containing protein [Microbulbifer hainanensis]
MSTNLTELEKRRLLRIAFGSCSGFFLCKLLGWPFGIFFTVFPMLLLGMLPRFDRLIAAQFLGSAVLNVVEVWLLYTFFAPYPPLMTLAVFAVFCWHFRLMASTPYFLLGAAGLVTLSTLLHFSSYVSTNIMDMVATIGLASLFSVVAAAVLYWLIPETETVAPPPRQNLTASQINHRTLMGAILATLSFMVFQTLDLKDSLSAQVATMLVLFPMTYQGTLIAAWKRCQGVAYGCVLAIGVQLLLYDLISHLLLVVLALFITVLMTAKLHLVERAGSGMGFGALTTVGILFGQYMQPHKDILYGTAYRLTSVTVALLVLMLFAYLLDGFLNRFELTRN